VIGHSKIRLDQAHPKGQIGGRDQEADLLLHRNLLILVWHFSHCWYMLKRRELAVITYYDYPSNDYDYYHSDRSDWSYKDIGSRSLGRSRSRSRSRTHNTLRDTFWTATTSRLRRPTTEQELHQVIGRCKIRLDQTHPKSQKGGPDQEPDLLLNMNLLILVWHFSHCWCMLKLRESKL